MIRNKTNHPEKQNNQDTLSIYDHILELRARLLWYLVFLCVASAVAYYYNSQITALLIAPLQQNLYYTNPVGGFQFTLQVAIFAGFIVTVPVLSYQIINFIRPAFHAVSYRSILLYLCVSVLLVILGVITAYLLIVPTTLRFLQSFGGDAIQPLITADAYFGFITWYLSGFAILFQLPLLMILLNQIAGVSHSVFLKYQRIVIAVSFVAAAILTPTPDVFNLMLFALPLLALYYGSICIILVMSLFKKSSGA